MNKTLIDFLRFLKDNGVYEKYFNAFFKSHHIRFHNWVNWAMYVIVHLDRIDLIENAFFFSCTEEGYEFWSKISNKYSEYAKNKQR